MKLMMIAVFFKGIDALGSVAHAHRYEKGKFLVINWCDKNFGTYTGTDNRPPYPDGDGDNTRNTDDVFKKFEVYILASDECDASRDDDFFKTASGAKWLKHMETGKDTGKVHVLRHPKRNWTNYQKGMKKLTGDKPQHSATLSGLVDANIKITLDTTHQGLIANSETVISTQLQDQGLPVHMVEGQTVIRMELKNRKNPRQSFKPIVTKRENSFKITGIELKKKDSPPTTLIIQPVMGTQADGENVFGVSYYKAPDFKLTFESDDWENEVESWTNWEQDNEEWKKSVCIVDGWGYEDSLYVRNIWDRNWKNGCMDLYSVQTEAR